MMHSINVTLEIQTRPCGKTTAVLLHTTRAQSMTPGIPEYRHQSHSRVVPPTLSGVFPYDMIYPDSWVRYRDAQRKSCCQKSAYKGTRQKRAA